MRLDRFRGIGLTIRQTPHLYQQSEWGEPDPELQTCETAACVAGWAVALYGEVETLQQFRIRDGEFGGIQSYAAELLELTEEEALVLFKSHWPLYFLEEEPRAKFLAKLKDVGRHIESFTPTPDQAARILEQISDGELSILVLKDT